MKRLIFNFICICPLFSIGQVPVEMVKDCDDDYEMVFMQKIINARWINNDTAFATWINIKFKEAFPKCKIAKNDTVFIDYIVRKDGYMEVNKLNSSQSEQYLKRLDVFKSLIGHNQNWEPSLNNGRSVNQNGIIKVFRNNQQFEAINQLDTFKLVNWYFDLAYLQDYFLKNLKLEAIENSAIQKGEMEFWIDFVVDNSGRLKIYRSSFYSIIDNNNEFKYVNSSTKRALCLARVKFQNFVSRLPVLAKCDPNAVQNCRSSFEKIYFKIHVL